MVKRTKKGSKQVETLAHAEAKRKNIPTAELQSVAERMEEQDPFEPVTYPRANPLAESEKRERDEDLDPQIVWKGATIHLNPEQIEEITNTGKLEIGEAQLTWRGKDTQDWSDLVVQAPPLYIQEKIHPKAIIEELKRQSEKRAKEEADIPDLFDMFEDFNGIDPKAKTEFYQHDQNWQNRMILGDSLQVMASLAEREGLRGKVQCIYFDPPYGIGFGSNWQVSTRNKNMSNTDKKSEISREPEQVKAFRDTWKNGVHSYFSYLRDRFTVMRDLLASEGSMFVQIGDENVHRVRSILEEVFGEENFISLITVRKTSSFPSSTLASVCDYIIWFSKDKTRIKVRALFDAQPFELGAGNARWLELTDFSYRGVTRKEARGEQAIPKGAKPYKPDNLISQGRSKDPQPFALRGVNVDPWSKNAHWKANYPDGMRRLQKANRICVTANSLHYRRYHSDYPWTARDNIWNDTGTGGFTDQKIYIVQTPTKMVARCILMTTDPGDLVLDPTCGSGTTAYVAEQWGRRWITLDTSRVAMALARTRLMGARYPYYLLSDSLEGREKEEYLTGIPQSDTSSREDIRQGFVYERAPHITLKSIANNTEIDVIWENYQSDLETLRTQLNNVLGGSWEEWEIPMDAQEDWPVNIKNTHDKWWKLRTARQEEIDKSIAHKAEVELLYTRPYENKAKVRVSGPFTVESLSPHRVVPADEEELLEGNRDHQEASFTDFTAMIMENLKSAGVHQAAREDRIEFNSIEGWPGSGYIAAVGNFLDGMVEKRAAIFVGPEFGTITRADLTAAAREANEARFDALIACGFNFDAHSTELTRMGPLPILKAKMNQDLHMSGELKNTGKGNMFTIIGEPDIEWKFDDDGKIIVEVLGLDVFDLKTSEVRASEKDDIAAWFIDTDYNEESFFVRHAYFLGANDPYKALKTSLKAEIDKEAWETLYRDVSRSFAKPETGRFAVKVINHFGDEVMKVFSV